MTASSVSDIKIIEKEYQSLYIYSQVMHLDFRAVRCHREVTGENRKDGRKVI